jgi:hypothetical protein
MLSREKVSPHRSTDSFTVPSLAEWAEANWSVGRDGLANPKIGLNHRFRRRYVNGPCSAASPNRTGCTAVDISNGHQDDGSDNQRRPLHGDASAVAKLKTLASFENACKNHDSLAVD